MPVITLAEPSPMFPLEYDGAIETAGSTTVPFMTAPGVCASAAVDKIKAARIADRRGMRGAAIRRLSPRGQHGPSSATISAMIRIALALLMVPAAFAQNGVPYDILITGGKIVDGSGNPWFRGDIAISGDSIAALGLLSGAPAKVTLDASGFVVAPGFIDIHSHGRRGIFETPTAANYLHEGVTTLVEGPDGSSPLPLGPFLDRVAKTPISINFASMAGQGTMRRRTESKLSIPAKYAKTQNTPPLFYRQGNTNCTSIPRFPQTPETSWEIDAKEKFQ
jgi:hypothetical protein